VKACDNASAGVLITDPHGRYLFFERPTPPWGLAAPAGHVFDEHDNHERAAIQETHEEFGLAVAFLNLAIEGWLHNACRRGPGAEGTGHFWRVYTATVSQESIDHPDAEREIKDVRWLTPAELQQLADVTVDLARGRIDVFMFKANPGLEPSWVIWLTRLQIITVREDDLQAVTRLAGKPAGAGEPRR
jgi:8-oxo-dGTP pyrophosphatase MutT (NUDIX family)